MKVSPLTAEASFGRMVSGLRAADIADGGVRDTLRRLWIDHGLIVFRDGDCDVDFQIGLSKCFGELQIHSVREMLHPEREELLMLSGEPGGGAVMDVNGEALVGFIPWHSDQRFTAETNHGGILRITTMPERGGNTGFVDQIGAYEALSQQMRGRIEALEVAYRLHVGDDNWRYLPFQKARITQPAAFQKALEQRVRAGAFPTVVHPLVYRQAETGRKVLNFSPTFVSHVLGLSPEESDALIWELAEHITDESRVYDHIWQEGDLVLWDNWRMLHCARGVPLGMIRHGQRTTIAGDHALGRILEAA